MASHIVAPWLVVAALCGVAFASANEAASANVSFDEDSDYVCVAGRGEGDCARTPSVAELAEGPASCEEQLRECTSEFTREITKARNRGFQELKKAHEQDIAAELYLLERKHRRETDRLQYDLEKSKRDLFQKDELIRALEQRLSIAEKQIEQHSSGARCQVLGNRASALDDELRFVQAQLQAKKDSLFELSQQLSAKHQELAHRTSEAEDKTTEAEQRALAAEDRVRSAEARAVLSRRRELRALKRVRRRVAQVVRPSSSMAADGQTGDNATDAVNHTGQHDAKAREPDAWARRWIASVEALAQAIRSMVPTHDAEVASMYSRISSHVSVIVADLEDLEFVGVDHPFVRAGLWAAAFGTVATWRYLWVFIFRLIVSDCLAVVSSASACCCCRRTAAGRAEEEGAG